MNNARFCSLFASVSLAILTACGTPGSDDTESGDDLTASPATFDPFTQMTAALKAATSCTTPKAMQLSAAASGKNLAWTWSFLGANGKQCEVAVNASSAKQSSSSSNAISTGDDTLYVSTLKINFPAAMAIAKAQKLTAVPASVLLTKPAGLDAVWVLQYSATSALEIDASSGAVAGAGQLTIIVEPSDNAQALIDAMNGAKKSVHMTMYLLSNTGIIGALISQHQAGHEVKVLLNQTFPAGTGLSNAAVFAQLHNAGVDVEWAPANFTYTHEKCVMIDAKTAWIMTMNADKAAPTANREYLAVDTAPADVAEAEAIFAHDFANTAYTPSGALLVSPVNARSQITALISEAKTRIDMEGEKLEDASIAAAIAARADHGVAVRIVLPNAGTTQQQAQTAMMKQHGVQVVEDAQLYIHAKTIVIDLGKTYVGSQNYSATSLDSNRELGLIFAIPSETDKILAAIDTDFAAGTSL